MRHVAAWARRMHSIPFLNTFIQSHYRYNKRERNENINI